MNDELVPAPAPLIPKELLESQPHGFFVLPPELLQTLGGRSQREIYILMSEMAQENPNYHFSIKDSYALFDDTGMPGPRTEFVIYWDRK